MEERVTFALLMGGGGRRFGGKKQFAPFKGEPLYFHSLKAAIRWGKCASFLLVVPPEDKGRVKEETSSIPVPLAILDGGPVRAESAWRAVQEAYREDPDGMVLLHDAARPLEDLSVLDSLLEEARKEGGAVPVLPLEESALLIGEEGEDPIDYLDRGKVRLVQTPQCFRTHLLFEAEREAGQARCRFTDEGSLFLKSKGRLGICEGSPLHRKITRKEDMR